jgi:hypothetical protein
MFLPPPFFSQAKTTSNSSGGTIATIAKNSSSWLISFRWEE